MPFDRILAMYGNYEERKIARFEEGVLKVSTASVTDGRKPYETAVIHPKYNNGNWVIVECYDDMDSAKLGHARWVEKMRSNPPDTLTDCANSEISQMIQRIMGE